VQGLGEGERGQLLNEAAKYVVEHLFGQRSQRSKVGTQKFVILHDMHNTPRSWPQTVLGINYCMMHITGGHSCSVASAAATLADIPTP
jgi:hypothetical protein